MSLLRKTHYYVQGYSITEQVRETWFTEDTSDEIVNKEKLILHRGKELLKKGYLIEELLTVFIIEPDILISLKKFEDKLNIIRDNNQVYSTIKDGSCEVKFAEKRNLKELKNNSVHWDITELFNTLTPQIF